METDEDVDVKIIENSKTWPLDNVAGHKFLCEVCDLEVMLTDEKAYELGWDYPPFMGAWGVISPRTCGECTVDKTAWYWLVQNGTEDLSQMSERHLRTIERILAERDRAEA